MVNFKIMVYQMQNCQINNYEIAEEIKKFYNSIFNKKSLNSIVIETVFRDRE